MQFKTYFLGLSPDERHQFAELVGASAGHLTNVAYGYKQMAPEICVSVERESGMQVTRKELRPDDFERYWPDLIAEKSGV